MFKLNGGVVSQQQNPSLTCSYGPSMDVSSSIRHVCLLVIDMKKQLQPLRQLAILEYLAVVANLLGRQWLQSFSPNFLQDRDQL